ncbi:MAG: GNAT family N-acetyltransferase [Armatimonadetes bacterium]|nr:GNAT family N-acetyltransferase [Armatimonadota bacterium]
MTTSLGSVTLRGGERMTIKRIECPAEDYAEPLAHFLEHKGDHTFRDLTRRLRGDYAEVSLDRWFVGELDGRIVSQMGYMLARDTLDVGVFGHVYTEPEHRGKGAASVLMQALMDDFNAGPGQALLCGTGSESAARIYARHGFVALDPARAPVGPLAYIKPDFAADFEELQQIFFEAGHDTHVRPAHMGDRAKVDKVLAQADAVRAMAGEWHRCHLAAQWSDFVHMYQAVEDGRGPLDVLETEARHVVGYAFAFDTGSPMEAGSRTLDLLVHPNYHDRASTLAQHTCARALAEGARAVRCYLPQIDAPRIEILRAAGFVEEHRYSDYCMNGNRPIDLVVMVAR